MHREEQFGLSGLRRAPPLPVVGARPHTGTGQSLLGGFGCRRWEGKGGPRLLFKRQTQKMLQHLWFTFPFLSFCFEATFLRCACMSASHTCPSTAQAQQTLQHICCGCSARACSGTRAHGRSFQSSACCSASYGQLSVCPSVHPSQPRALPPAGPSPPLVRLRSPVGPTVDPG